MPTCTDMYTVNSCTGWCMTNTELYGLIHHMHTDHLQLNLKPGNTVLSSIIFEMNYFT